MRGDLFTAKLYFRIVPNKEIRMSFVPDPDIASILRNFPGCEGNEVVIPLNTTWQEALEKMGNLLVRIAVAAERFHA